MDILEYLKSLSSSLESTAADLAIVLAAGHGKRIKSNTSKMLHEIWGEPTVARVAAAAAAGLGSDNQVIVVGIKAKEVAGTVGKRNNRIFAYQAEQNGTGHATRSALEQIPDNDYSGDIHIFPGDMGLLTAEAIRKFKSAFADSGCDMMVLTGVYEGNPDENYYGRIVRVPDHDVAGAISGEDAGKVIEIKEHKDILALGEDKKYSVNYNGLTYGFSKQELLENNEFNTGVFAFKSDHLKVRIRDLGTNNVQGELYLTDLIAIFNANGLSVGAVPADDNRTVLGFNTKSVLLEMNEIACQRVYEQIRNLVAIENATDFFIAEDVVRQIVELDREKAPVDMFFGKGAYVGKGVALNKGVHIGRLAKVSGKVVLGENVRVGAGVSIFGSSDHPTKIGNNVIITGRSGIVGCTIEDDVLIEESILECKHIKRIENGNGQVQAVRFVQPVQQGLDAISDLEN